MDINTIMQAIGSIGFPIVACIGLFYLYNETITKLVNTLTKMDTTLDRICDELKLEKKEKEE